MEISSDRGPTEPLISTKPSQGTSDSYRSEFNMILRPARPQPKRGQLTQTSRETAPTQETDSHTTTEKKMEQATQITRTTMDDKDGALVQEPGGVSNTQGERNALITSPVHRSCQGGVLPMVGNDVPTSSGAATEIYARSGAAAELCASTVIPRVTEPEVVAPRVTVPKKPAVIPPNSVAKTQRDCSGSAHLQRQKVLREVREWSRCFKSSRDADKSSDPDSSTRAAPASVNHYACNIWIKWKRTLSVR